MVGASFRREHRDASVLMAIVATVLVSAALTSYMDFSLAGSDRTLVAQMLGAQLYFSPVSAGVIITGMAAAEVYFVSRLERAGKVAESVVLMSVAVTAGLVTLAFAKGFVDAFFSNSGVVVLFVLSLGVFLTLFLTFLVLIGEYSDLVKNLLLVVFSSTMGAFFSLVFPTAQLLILVLTMMVLDLALTYSQARQGYRGEPSKLAFTTRDWGVGLGDLIVYTMITGKALLAFGPLAFVLSLALLITGVGVAVRLTRRSELRFLPGVLIGGGFACLPLLILSVA